MNSYVTGAAVKTLREKKGLTQRQLADRIAVMEHVQSTKTLFVLKQYKQSGVLTGAARTANSEGRLVVSY